MNPSTLLEVDPDTPWRSLPTDVRHVILNKVDEMENNDINRMKRDVDAKLANLRRIGEHMPLDYNVQMLRAESDALGDYQYAVRALERDHHIHYLGTGMESSSPGNTVLLKAQRQAKDAMKDATRQTLLAVKPRIRRQRKK
jgi:hypothetical protein